MDIFFAYFAVFLQTLILSIPFIILLLIKFGSKNPTPHPIPIGFGYAIYHFNSFLAGTFVGLTILRVGLVRHDDITIFLALLYILIPPFFIRVRKRQSKVYGFDILLVFTLIFLVFGAFLVIHREVVRNTETNGYGYYEIITYEGKHKYHKQVAYHPRFRFRFKFSYHDKEGEKLAFIRLTTPPEGYYFTFLSSPFTSISYSSTDELKTGLHKINNYDYDYNLSSSNNERFTNTKVNKIHLYISKIKDDYISGWLKLDAHSYKRLSDSQYVKPKKQKVKIKIYFNNVKMGY